MPTTTPKTWKVSDLELDETEFMILVEALALTPCERLLDIDIYTNSGQLLNWRCTKDKVLELVKKLDDFVMENI